MANEIKNFSPTEMSPQTVSKEEVDAILDYVDNYQAAPTDVNGTTATDGTTSPQPLLVPDYEGNLTLFYWLLTGIIVLLIAIIVMSGSISSLVRSDYFIKKLNEQKNTKTLSVILIVGLFSLLYPNSSYALTFMNAGEATEGIPWLKVETTDLYFMVAINLILLGIVFYLRGMFKQFIEMVRPPKIQEESVSLKKINAILTDAVAIEEEHTILMQHEYDGIRELDNNLPPWWVWGFFATILFAIVYLFNYHVFKSSDLQYKAYDKEMSQAKKDIDTYLSKMAMNVDETNATLLTDEGALSSGKALFDANCTVCHNPKGEGNIGPNLTDDHWIYGPDVKDLFKTIKYGTPNGMPEHASKLNPVQLQQIASFVISMPYTKGKEPQGKEYK
jgi:cytochrome c oxidase cbb3-type subunit 3